MKDSHKKEEEWGSRKQDQKEISGDEGKAQNYSNAAGPRSNSNKQGRKNRRKSQKEKKEKKKREDLICMTTLKEFQGSGEELGTGFGTEMSKQTKK